MTNDEIRQLIQQVRPYFRARLGKTTHKRVSEDWYFHALGFVRDEMTYVFGINLGFFVADATEMYRYAGMSITVRANGESQDVRKKYIDFFAKHLKSWTNRPYERYTSDRGGEGLLITRYIELKDNSQEDIIEFIRQAIDEFHPIYKQVMLDSKLFEYVVRAETPWDKSFVELATDMQE